MTFISKSNNIKDCWCRRCTKEQEIELRNSDECRRSIEAVRNGYIEMKEQNFYRLVAGTAPDGQEEVYRNNNNLIESNKVLLDYDLTDWKEKLWAQIEGHEEELGVLHAEESCRKKLHTTVRRIDGLTIEQTIEWFENRFGVKFDHTAKSLAQPCLLVPMDQVLYVDDDYYLDVVEPQQQDISDFQVDTPIVLTEEEEMEQFINDLAEAQAATDFDEDIDLCSTTELTTDDSELITDDSELITDDSELATDDSELAAENSTNAYHREYDNDYDECQRIIDLVCKAKIDLTQEYPIWWRLGVAIWNCMGYDGVEEYERLSQFYPNYNQKETDDVYKNIAKRDYNRITLGTLVWVCKKAGLFS